MYEIDKGEDERGWRMKVWNKLVATGFPLAFDAG